MQRSYDESQVTAAHRKRTAVATLLNFLVIPAIMTLSLFFLRDQNYILVSLVVLALTMAPFFMVFERRKPKAREIVLIAVMCAITVCAHMLSHATIPVHPGTAIVIACGIALGPEAGFLIGSLSRFVLNFYTGQGSWTPWQMFTWGLLGFLAGLVFHRGNLNEKHKRNFTVVLGPVLCVVFMTVVAYVTYLLFPPADGSTFWGWRLYAFGAAGLLLGVLVQRKRLTVDPITLTSFTFFTTFIIYGGAMNIFSVISAVGLPDSPEVSWETLRLYFIMGAPYDLSHAGLSALVSLLFGEKIIAKLERIKLKYGIYR